MNNLTYRLATINDSELLFRWVNDPAVRKSAYRTKQITHQEHEKWFKKTINDNDVEIYIFYSDETPIGQVRLNYFGKNGEIDYSVDSLFRGKGFGTAIIGLTEEIVLKTHPNIITLIANVKFENYASQKIFLKNSYNEKIIGLSKNYSKNIR